MKEFQGEITMSVPETNTHQVRFPVRTAEELQSIAEALRKKGAAR